MGQVRSTVTLVIILLLAYNFLVNDHTASMPLKVGVALLVPIFLYFDFRLVQTLKQRNQMRRSTIPPSLVSGLTRSIVLLLMIAVSTVGSHFDSPEKKVRSTAQASSATVKAALKAAVAVKHSH